MSRMSRLANRTRFNVKHDAFRDGVRQVSHGKGGKRLPIWAISKRHLFHSPHGGMHPSTARVNRARSTISRIVKSLRPDTSFALAT